jgi:CRP-like cAMP-binding protein
MGNSTAKHYEQFRKKPTSFRDVLDRLGRREDVLSKISSRERKEIIKCGVVCKYRNAQNLFVQGTPHKYSYFILQGVVRTTSLSPNNKEYTVSYWTKGDLVGGPYFLNDNAIYLWSGYAAEPVEVLAISGNSLRELAFRFPALSVAMLDALSLKIHWFSLLLQIIGTQSVEGRLGILLLGLGTAYGTEVHNGLMIRYTFTQTDLARMIGVSRQWVNTALSHFRKKHALKIVKGRFLIEDPEILVQSFDPQAVKTP